MYKFKSFLVVLYLIIVVLIAVWSVIRFFRNLKKSNFRIRYAVTLLLICAFAIHTVCKLYPYTKANDQTIPLEIYETIDLPPERSIIYPGDNWHAIYEQFGLYAESFFISPHDEKSYLYGFEWPEMDFGNHTYIVSYGWELESVTYNVWETIDAPIRTGAYSGSAARKGEFNPHKVYTYEIDKIRIDNGA